MKKILPVLSWITAFSIAMAFLETAVVIYLRELLYPGGFSFPLSPMPENLLFTEIIRELATILMLLGIGVLAGRTFSEKFAWFIYAFATWDIFYYIFLKILINWPESIMTWDLLFLVPFTWTGPVISPVIVSLTMMSLALVILRYSARGYNTRIIRIEWGLFIAGSVIIIIAFTCDYLRFMLHYFSIKEILCLPDKQPLYQTALTYVPHKFNWSLFISGEVILGIAIFLYRKRVKKVNQLSSFLS